MLFRSRLRIAVLAAATVDVRECWPWETAATLLPSARRPRGEKRGARHKVAAACLQLVWFASCIQIACICLELNVLCRDVVLEASASARDGLGAVFF